MQRRLIDWWNIEFDQKEKDSIFKAINNRDIAQGRLTEQFEQSLAKLLDVQYAVCTTSGTAALMMAFMALGVGPADEVIMSNRTFIATAHAAMILGAKIRPIDVKPNQMLIDEVLIEREINHKTRVIIGVHLNGQGCNIKKIIEIAKKHRLPVVEDSAQAFLSKLNGRYLGTFSRFGCFSLGLAKLITTGQGGFVVCKSEDEFIKLKRIRNQGVNNVRTDRNYDMLAGNFKFTDIQAAIGLAQIAKVRKKIQRQLSIYKKYRDGLRSIKSLKCVEVNVDAGAIPLRAEFICTERDKFITQMRQHFITIVPGMPSLNESPHLNCNGNFINSQLFSNHLVTLPCGPDQPMKNIEWVIEIVKKVSSNLKSW